MMPRIPRRLAAGGLCLLLALSILSPLSPIPARAALNLVVARAQKP